MADFNIAFPKTVSNEGYYVSQEWARAHGDSRSGETYMGIDRGANPTWEGWAVIDRYKAQHGTPGWNFRFPVELGLEDMVKKRAKALYWDAIKGDEIQNQDVAEIIFEQKWGGYGGIKRIQQVMNTMLPNPVKANGVVGSDTLTAINSLPPAKLHSAIWNDRKTWIETVGAKVNAGAVKGWLSRLDRFKSSIGEDITRAEQAISETAHKGLDIVKKKPVILVTGVVLLLVSGFFIYKYYSTRQTTTT